MEKNKRKIINIIELPEICQRGLLLLHQDDTGGQRWDVLWEKLRRCSLCATNIFKGEKFPNADHLKIETGTAIRVYMVVACQGRASWVCCSQTILQLPSYVFNKKTHLLQYAVLCFTVGIFRIYYDMPFVYGLYGVGYPGLISIILLAWSIWAFESQESWISM